MSETPRVTKAVPTCSLPKKHFAILFEGAWMFHPDRNTGEPRIIASCPITTGHACKFGRWDDLERNVVALKGLTTTDMRERRNFTVTVQGAKRPAINFATLFTDAALRYPFIYLAGKHSHAAAKNSRLLFRISRKSETMRNVSIPMPTCVRAAGALTTAEIGGNHKGSLFGGNVTVKRPFVTFIFIYEYDELCTAKVKVSSRETGVIDTIASPKPHLIFKIRPDPHKMVMDCGSMTMQDADESALKYHANETFENVRQSVSLVSNSTARGGGLCDIALYHGQENMCFEQGDTGLDSAELGLSPEKCDLKKGGKLPACAGGGVVVGPGDGG